MSQQTQIERVVPLWLEWVQRWPRPSALAADPPGDAVRAWGRLGYPRRALWLHEAATVIAREHGDEVPRDVDELLRLPGIGPYTARAVAVFAYGERHPVVDTNTRRVIARAVHGIAAAGMPSPRDLVDQAQLLPLEVQQSVKFNQSIMELGALVCTARKPDCDACPIAAWCRWRAAGYPDNAPVKRPKQARFEGSDRQVRGRILAHLREHFEPLTREHLLATVLASGEAPQSQVTRAYDSLLADGLVVEENGVARLP